MVLEMRRRGIRIDVAAAERARDHLLQKRDAIFAELSEKLGANVGMAEIGRNKWLAETFDRHGIKYPRTAKGNPSFTAGTSGWMHRHEHWLPQLIVRADKLNNAGANFVQHYIGVRIPRQEKIQGEWVTVWYDPFCAKAVTLVGTNLPEPLISRSIVIELWKMKSGEAVEKVDPLNPELMDAFKTLRRMLRRWADDHGAALKAARPTTPTAFINRSADNWILQWAIADTAGADWGQQARDAAERLSQAGIVEPSWLERLASEFWILFVEPQDKAAPLERIPSADLVKRLTDDPVSVWCDYGRGRPVTQREVAALLRKLHVHPRSIGKRRVKGYYAHDLFQKQVFERILGRDPLIRSRSESTVKPARAKARKRKAR
jgi:hypothetical protein